MGNSESIRVEIKHAFEEYAPPGWKQYGSVNFHVNKGERVYDLIQKMNRFRSPAHEIKNLLDDSGYPVENSQKITHQKSVFYV
jgi:hypothetical protein